MQTKTILIMSAIVTVTAVSLAHDQGTITGWGSNVGSGDPPPYYGQATPPDGNDYIAIDAGMYHSITLKSDGSLLAWGADDNDYGDITNQVDDTPSGTDFTTIAAGYYHNVAIKTDFSLAAWGDDYYGQATVPSGNDFIAVVAGYAHSLALTSGGALMAWGVDDQDIDDEGQVRDTPTDNGYIAIAAGKKFNIAIQSSGGAPTSGSLVGWGKDFHDSLTDIPEGDDFVAVVAGDAHGLALKTDGTLVAWGHDDGSITDHKQVTDTPTDGGYMAIAAGYYHNVAMKEDGTIVSWGRDNKDQVTDNPSGNNFIAIAGGGYHSLAMELNCLYQLQGDFDDNCRVNLADFQILASAWMSAYTFSDLQSMTAHWLINCRLTPSDPACVPDP